jgi:signal peptide peptidase SppA
MWSWAGYDTVQASVERACADERVKGLLLDLDSPGGVVAGCFDAARAMRAAIEASGKPCVAVASELACSAAYALACVADEIVVPETGIVGSVGVMGTMTSLARMYAEMGVDQRVIASGAAKGDGHPALPISKEALARAQERIDATAQVFAAWVSERRGMTSAAVMALDARVFAGPAAVTAGLADRVSSGAAALAAMQKRATPTTDPQRPLGAPPAAGAANHTQRHTMHPILAALGVTTDAEGLQAATSLLSLRAQVRAVTGASDDAAALGALHAMKRDAESANALRAQMEADRKAAVAAERASILDGAVTGPTSVADFTFDAPACEAGLISADLTIGWSGIFGQWVEIAMQVRDADGQVSDALVVTACAPNEDGTLADCGPLPVDTGDTGAPDDTGAPVETGDTGGGTTTPPDTGGTSTPTDTGAAETGDTGVR